MAQKTTRNPEDVDKLKQEMNAAEADFRNAKLAYYNNTDYKGSRVAYEELEGYAKAFIAANEAVQKAVFGKIQIKLTVARLMRE